MSLHHPVKRHILNHFSRRYIVLSIPLITTLTAIFCFFALTIVFTLVDDAIIFFIPIALTIYSSSYVMVWMYRIASIITQQRRDGMIHVMGVVPGGQLFIYVVVCHVILNSNDMLGWLGVVRKMIMLFVIVAFFMATLLAFTQMNTVEFSSFALLVLSLLIITLLIHLEHSQAIMLGCGVAIYTALLKDTSTDTHIVALSAYLLIQLMTYVIAIGWLFLLPTDQWMAFSVSSLLFYFLIRELIINRLWNQIIHETS